MSRVSAFRTPARPSQRDTRAVAGAAITQAGHVQDVIQRGIIPALGAAQGALTVESIHREAGDAALDARLRVHRCDIDGNRGGAHERMDNMTARIEALEWSHAQSLDDSTLLACSLWARLRWLFTGKVR